MLNCQVAILETTFILKIVLTYNQQSINNYTEYIIND